MKLVCISCFNYYDNRIEYVAERFQAMGGEVVYITTDYDTVKRQTFVSPVDGAIQIPVIHYQKNISLMRIYSHYRFSKAVARELEVLKPDVIYAMVPPNSLVDQIRRHKAKHPQVSVIYDIYDLWPQSFPLSSWKKFLSLPFKGWNNLRDNHMNEADYIVTECQLYQDYFEAKFGGLIPDSQVFYLSQAPVLSQVPHKQIEEVLHLAYLGSINTLVHIELIVATLARLQQFRPVFFHLIGDGENRDHFLQLLKDESIPYKYYGKVFDDQTKAEIFSQVDFAFNCMRSIPTVGLTMKSIEYFKFSIPILNNISGDTQAFVSTQGIGFSLSEEKIDDTVDQILSVTSEDLMKMKVNTFELYQNHFTPEAARRVVGEMFDKVFYLKHMEK